jgi:hypothetical protein
MANYYHPVNVGQSVQHSRGVVGRIVIHDDDFEIFERLTQETLHRLLEEAAVVVVGDDVRDPWIEPAHLSAAAMT